MGHIIYPVKKISGAWNPNFTMENLIFMYLKFFWPARWCGSMNTMPCLHKRIFFSLLWQLFLILLKGWERIWWKTGSTYGKLLMVWIGCTHLLPPFDRLLSVWSIIHRHFLLKGFPKPRKANLNMLCSFIEKDCFKLPHHPG